MMILREPIRPPHKRPNRTRKKCDSMPPAQVRLASLEGGEFAQVECWPDLASLHDGFCDWSAANCPSTVELGWFGSKCTEVSSREIIVPVDSQPKLTPLCSSRLRPLIEENQLLPELRNIERWGSLIEWVGGKLAKDRWFQFITLLIQPAQQDPLQGMLFRVCSALQHIRRLHVQFGPPSCLRNISRLAQEVRDSQESICDDLRALFHFFPPYFEDQLFWIDKAFDKAKKDWLELERRDTSLFASTAASVCWDTEDESLLQSLVATTSVAKSKWVARRLFVRLERVPPKHATKMMKRMKLLADVSDDTVSNVLKKRRVPKAIHKLEQLNVAFLEYAFESDPLSRRLHAVTKGEIDCSFGNDFCREIVSSWLDWLENWTHKSLTCKQIWAWVEVLRLLSAINHLSPKIAWRWQGWLLSMSRECGRAFQTSPDVHSDPQTQQTYREFRFYRSVAGLAAKPSRRIQRFLSANESRARELEYLERLNASDSLSERAELRLEHLRRNPRLKLVHARKLRRELYAGAMNASIQSAQTWMAKQIATLHSGMQIPWSKRLTSQEETDFLVLLSRLGYGTKRSLIAGLQSHANNPTGFRKIGSKNSAWLEQATQKGLCAEHWLSAPSVQIRVAEKIASKNELRSRRLIIRLSSDPRDVLWMGRPFSSCLDLRGGMYCASTAANWMDGNKQLLVVSDSAGRMVARKLLALTESLGLIGYRLYSSLDEPDAAEHNEPRLCDHVKQYCENLAAKIGAQLVDEGTPKSLHGSQWYNDGEIAWSENANC